MDKKTIIERYIRKNWDEGLLFEAWNARCIEDYDYDSIIEPMDNFEEVAKMWVDDEMKGVCWLLNRFKYGNFSMGDRYWVLDGYGNLASFDYISDKRCKASFEEIAEFLTRDGHINEQFLPEADIKDILFLECKLTEEQIETVLKDWNPYTDDWNEILPHTQE